MRIGPAGVICIVMGDPVARPKYGFAAECPMFLEERLQVIRELLVRVADRASFSEIGWCDFCAYRKHIATLKLPPNGEG